MTRRCLHGIAASVRITKLLGETRPSGDNRVRDVLRQDHREPRVRDAIEHADASEPSSPNRLYIRFTKKNQLSARWALNLSGDRPLRLSGIARQEGNCRRHSVCVSPLQTKPLSIDVDSNKERSTRSGGDASSSILTQYTFTPEFRHVP